MQVYTGEGPRRHGILPDRSPLAIQAEEPFPKLISDGGTWRNEVAKFNMLVLKRMGHLLVVAVSALGLILLVKFAFDWLENRRERRHLANVMSRLQSLQSLPVPIPPERRQGTTEQNASSSPTEHR